jgi:hypothetical protein
MTMRGAWRAPQKMMCHIHCVLQIIKDTLPAMVKLRDAGKVRYGWLSAEKPAAMPGVCAPGVIQLFFHACRAGEACGLLRPAPGLL